MSERTDCIIVTAGPTYLDVDAYACCVAMAELLCLQGKNAVAYSNAPCNYGVCPSFLKEAPIETALPENVGVRNAEYVIVDVSDYEYIGDSVPQQRVVAIYDHHVGFEDHWRRRIGDNAHIEFIGAAATLIYREWKRANLLDKLSPVTAKLLIAAILDNTLNLSSSNTTREDIEAFEDLCKRATVGKEWCAWYFTEVQQAVQADLKEAILKDVKTIRQNEYLPPKIAQLCIWEVQSVLSRLTEIREWLDETAESWMMNLIDIKSHQGFIVCDDGYFQKQIEKTFGVVFMDGVAKMPAPFLRKEIIKKAIHKK